MTMLELQQVLGDTIKEIGALRDDDKSAMLTYIKAEHTAKVAKQMICNADIVLRADKLCGTHDRIDFLVGRLNQADGT